MAGARTPIRQKKSVQKSLIIIPAYNEAATISNVIQSIRRTLSNFDMIVVDDGSKDDTAEIAKANGIKVIELPYNLGVGGAMRAGFLYAYKQKYLCAVQIDADGQHAATEVEKLIKNLEKCDMVIGSRFSLEDKSYKIESYRKYAMKWLAFLVRAITNKKLTDVTSGFRAYNQTAIELFATHYPKHYLGDTVEAIVVAHKAGIHFCEVGVSMQERSGGQPSQTFLQASWHVVRATLAITISAISGFGLRENQ